MEGKFFNFRLILAIFTLCAVFSVGSADIQTRGAEGRIGATGGASADSSRRNDNNSGNITGSDSSTTSRSEGRGVSKEAQDIVARGSTNSAEIPRSSRGMTNDLDGNVVSRSAAARVGAVGGAASSGKIPVSSTGMTDNLGAGNVNRSGVSRSAQSRAAAMNFNTTTPPLRGTPSPAKGTSRSRNAATTGNLSRAGKLIGGGGASGARSAARSQMAPLVGPASARHIARSALGEGFTGCRSAYSECMDMFCAVANETYKKCICSDKYLDLDAQNKAISDAKEALNNFATMNLAFIEMSGDQAKAATSATEGEKAAGEDTSANAQKLNEILENLVNPKKAAVQKQKPSFSSGNFNLDDMWGDSEVVDGAVNTNLQGKALFSSTNAQCQQMVKDTCKGTNLAMIVSTYSLTIDGDCQKLQASVNKGMDEVKGKVRQLNVEMMNRRLNDFENRNSASAVECLENTLEDFQRDAVCGKDWIRCLDYTGKYIDQKGKPIYTTGFTDLTGLMEFGDGSRTLAEMPGNQQFVQMLNGKQNLIDALKSCQKEAGIVWKEAINRALIEIVQAQSRAVESVKQNCLDELTDCRNSRVAETGEVIKTVQGGEGGDAVKSVSTTSKVMANEACRSIQQSCEAIYGSDLLSNLFADMETKLERDLCEEKPGAAFMENRDQTCGDNANAINAVSCRPKICITDRNSCEKAGHFWRVKEDGELNKDEQRLKNAFLKGSPDCVSYEVYCNYTRGSTIKKDATGKFMKDNNGRYVCDAPTERHCKENGGAWLKENNTCIVDQWDCIEKVQGYIWAGGGCVPKPTNAEDCNRLGTTIWDSLVSECKANPTNKVECDSNPAFAWVGNRCWLRASAFEKACILAGGNVRDKNGDALKDNNRETIEKGTCQFPMTHQCNKTTLTQPNGSTSWKCN
ncbi:MAG: hypothetical protein LBB23_02470 [Rickettsiales bacterium]|jgi:hypothetical protein|nr:hypothetical protein [Rickettsiales bacterium]